jgi:hypothetical protein
MKADKFPKWFYDKAMANEVARRNCGEMYRKKTKEEKIVEKYRSSR